MIIGATYLTRYIQNIWANTCILASNSKYKYKPKVYVFNESRKPIS